MTGDKTPLAVFTFNRPEHARRSLAALAACRGLERCRPVIFCDAAARPEQEQAVEANRREAREWAARLGARVVEREANLGLAASIAGGVGELCAEHGRVIVVEDDLVVSPDFLAYMLDGLDRYQDRPEVMQISGFMFNLPLAHKPDTFFLPLTTTWGWATWRRAWESFDPRPPEADRLLADPDFRRGFDLDGAYAYSEMLRARLAGRNDSWGILWWLAVHRAGGLVLYPRDSLVYNCGLDNTGTHCGADDLGQPAPERFQAPRLPSPPAWPRRVAADQEVMEAIKQYLRCRQAQADGPAPVSALKRLARACLSPWRR